MQKGSYLGPSYPNDVIAEYLEKNHIKAVFYDDMEKLCEKTAEELADGKVAGWFQGRMEYGPRALGNRSILGDPRSETMQSVLNLKIKYRESFRPFAPAVLRERVHEYFEMDTDSPYMLLVSNVKQSRRRPFDKKAYLDKNKGDMLAAVNAGRSDIPAVTHIDYSARVQTVDQNDNPAFYALIKAFERKTGS